MEWIFLLKWLHVVSSTVLFGTGLGTAYYLWQAHRTRDPVIIAPVARMVVRADYIFTGTSGIVQPLSGIGLAQVEGYGLWESWLVLGYLLYGMAFLCWAIVVRLQIRAWKLSEQARQQGSALPPDYETVMRRWFLLGWPAFIALLIIFWLMIEKPLLW
jgi:uncharacterized membrane protein